MNVKNSTRTAQLSLTLALVLALPATAFAYVGPGAGLSVIGSVLAFLAAIVVAVFGFIWFPIRRFMRKRKQAAAAKAEENAAASGAAIEDADGLQAGVGESKS